MTFEDVSAYYLTCGKALNQTADHFGISKNKARKILITTGDFVSPLSARVSALLEAGMSTAEIAEELHMREKTIEDYVPYRKGVYNADEPSPNAIRIRRHRQKTK